MITVLFGCACGSKENLTLSQKTNFFESFIGKTPLRFSEFRKIGQESFRRYKNPFIRQFISFFGPLGVNSKIRNGHIINLIKKLELKGERLAVLDAGCGLGYSCFWLAQQNPNYEITALDIDQKAIQEGRLVSKQMGISNIHFENLDLSQLCEEQKYDLIYSMDVLEHIPDDMAAINALRRSIKPKGWLVLHLPRRYGELRRYLPGFKSFHSADHVREEYTMEEICVKLEKSKFQLVYQKYGYSWRGEIAFEFEIICFGNIQQFDYFLPSSLTL